MLIKNMTQEMSIDLLKGTHLGRIACAKDCQPYIVPFQFAYHEDYIYALATAGTRIEWMRANPLVCVEVEKIVSRDEWQTVVILGRYQELPKTAEFFEVRVIAHDLLGDVKGWWEPGYVKTRREGREHPRQSIYFRVLIDQISGHQGIPE